MFLNDIIASLWRPVFQNNIYAYAYITCNKNKFVSFNRIDKFKYEIVNDFHE